MLLLSALQRPMKKLLYSLKSELLLSAPISNHTFLLRVMPTNTAKQEISNNALICRPDTRLASVKDGQGNVVHQGFIERKHDVFSFSTTGIALVDSSKKDCSPAAPYYKKQTPLTTLKGQLKVFHDENKIEGTPMEIAVHWMQLISETVAYRKGVTNTGTTAEQAFELHCGVCQDFANILLTLLRADGIASRYVTGLMVGEGASHAWVEFHDGESWISIDPTHNKICDDSFIKFAHGVDFNACSLEKGVFKGEATQTTVSKASVKEI